MSEFRGKVVVVTGASEGIGRAICLALAPQGARLVLAARNGARLEELKKEVEALGGGALCVPTDVTEEAACKALIARAGEAYGQIDALVNNAGGTMWTTLEDITDLSIFDRLIRLNYLGSVYCTYYALPWLKKTRGRIVGVSSVAGITGVPTRTAYAASKHAMFGFFDSLRIEVAEQGISVTMAAPDYVVSEIHRRALGSDGKPLGVSPIHEAKVMKSDECARLIVEAMTRRERLLLTSSRGRLGRWLKLLAPQVMDNLAAKAIRDKQ